MELNEIRDHWNSLAKKHGLDIKSTTKTPTIKQLEIDALARALRTFMSDEQNVSVLEVGCGNGHNIFGLARIFPNVKFLGLDYSEEMIEAARKLMGELPSCELNFEVGDVLDLSEFQRRRKQFDFVITDRLLINLNSWDLQCEGLRQLASCLKPNGLLVLIENFKRTYGNQNQARSLLGLSERTPDPYNCFIDEALFEMFIQEDLNLELIGSENFASLHDLLLYVLLPHAYDGKVMYDHPLMESVTKLLEKVYKYGLTTFSFGTFGQNNLYLFKRKS